MSKIKIRCSQCGKSFKTSNAKQLICPDCEEKQRRERAAKTKGTPTSISAQVPATSTRVIPARPVTQYPPSQPKPHWLDQQQDVKVAAPELSEHARPPRLAVPERRERPTQPIAAGKLSPREESHSTPPSSLSHAKLETLPSQGTAGAPVTAHTGDRSAKQSGQSKKGAGEKSGKDHRAASATAKPKREPRLLTPPFIPTPEQVAAIEQRYLELAHPYEFDGIRTQISKELNVPKSAVKHVISDLRQREALPSWWELQTYHGSPEDLERIRTVYLPSLPIPSVGIHKQIATTLNLPPGVVYQAIKVIRTEMNLPQYNPPEEHDPASQANPMKAPSGSRLYTAAGENC